MIENNRPAVDASGSQAAATIDASGRAGLALLWQAYRYALDAGAQLWDFALENDQLYDTALTISDLRWLVAKGFAEHGQETSFYGDPHRSFRPSHGLNFVPTTCFVLTPTGAEFAGKVLKEGAAARQATVTPPRAVPAVRLTGVDQDEDVEARPVPPSSGHISAKHGTRNAMASSS